MMGMDLISEKGGYFRFSLVGWHNVLDLAFLYGWWPMGTEKPMLRTTWDSNYFTNSGQLVTRVDALMLSNALRKALDDVPDCLDVPKMIELAPGDHPYGPVIEAMKEEWGEEVTGVMGYNPALTPFEFFSGDDKEILVEFIGFCQHGAFRIF